MLNIVQEGRSYNHDQVEGELLGRTPWTNSLDELLGRTPWTNSLDELLGRTPWTNSLDELLGAPWFVHQREGDAGGRRRSGRGRTRIYTSSTDV
jgi:hypothetical protein